MDRLVLTADQIYAMAYVMKAKYLDYYYISLSNKRNDNKLWLSEKTKELVSLGLLLEDFSGETSIAPEVEALFLPLYFSTKESSLDEIILGDDERNVGYRFHYLDGNITMTKTIDEGFEVASITTDNISSIVCDLLHENYSSDSSKVDVKFDITKISRIFVLKSTEMNIRSKVATFVESEGCIYEEDSDNNVFSVSREDFANKLYMILTEV